MLPEVQVSLLQNNSDHDHDPIGSGAGQGGFESRTYQSKVR